MNLDRDLDTTRIVRSWLRRDEHESADRVLDNVLALLDATPQHRSSWPARRFADMNSFAKLAIAAAVLIAVAFVGINLLPRAGRNVGGPAPSPSPPASASPSLSPSPSLAPEPTPVEGAIPPTGRLAVGRHAFSQNGVDFSLEITSPDWSSSGISVAPDGGNLTKGVGLGSPGSAWILSWSIDGVFSDPCDHVAAPPAGPTTADLAASVAKIPGLKLLTGPTDLTVGGKATKFVSVKVPEDLPCAPSQFRLWYDDVRCGADYPCHRWATVAGETHQIWIIDADGTRVWIEAETYPASPPELAAEVRAIVESIKFE